MRVWTNTSFRAFDALPNSSSPDGSAGSTGGVEALLAGLAAGGPVACALARPEHPDRRQRRMSVPTRLDEISARRLVVAKPSYRPGQRSLAVGERLELRVECGGGAYVGDTIVEKRIERTDGEVTTVTGFVLRPPTSLVLEDRRHADRVSIASERPPLAEILHAPSHRSLATATVVDLALGGVRLRGPRSLIRSGDRVVVRGRLDTERCLHAAGVVVHAAEIPGAPLDACTDIGIRFTDTVPEVAAYIRDISARGTARRVA